MRARSLFALTVAVFLCSALPAAAQGEREKPQLPEGDGKAIVQNRCSVCHGLDMLPNQAGATADQWQKVFSTMVALPGDQPTVVSNYLAKSFPVQSKPERGDRSRKRDRVHQGMDTADARPAAARSALDAGRQHLVDGACSRTSSGGSIRRRVR